MTRLTDEQRRALEWFCDTDDDYTRFLVASSTIRAALAEIDAHRARCDAAAHDTAEIAALRAHAARMRNALLKYGSHEHNCMSVTAVGVNYRGQCTCGFDAAMGANDGTVRDASAEG